MVLPTNFVQAMLQYFLQYCELINENCVEATTEMEDTH